MTMRQPPSTIISRLSLPALLLAASLCAAPLAIAAAPPAKTPTKTAAPKKITPPVKPHAQSAAQSAAVAAAAATDAPLPVSNIDETRDLPDYPPGAVISQGEMQTYVTGEEDTFLDISRHYDLGYVELRAANPDIDPWAPGPGQTVVIPTQNLLPRARQEGIVVNLGEMRLYYFRDGAGKPPLTYPLGIGSEGLDTPTGETSIIRKVAGPEWHPTDRMKKLKPWLPDTVGAGPSNPLGTHAMYLGWPTFLIHGSNKPWGIGRRVSSGCMRMFPEDIVTVFGMVPVGTKVTVVDQPILVGWLSDGLYLEANPTKTQSGEIEINGSHTVVPMSEGLRRVILDASGLDEQRIDWPTVERVIKERRGYPVLIAQRKPGEPIPSPKMQPIVEPAKAPAPVKAIVKPAKAKKPVAKHELKRD